MIDHGAKRKTLLTLLLILLLVFGVICLTTNNSPLDLFVPALAFLFALLLDLRPSITGWQEYLAPRLKPYIPPAPSRAPPA
jgi:hypothetical protein